ncbi:PEP/pyruvate-binding domain-containing protein [Metabacillus malikii]|nr:PEP/pyruvate-binding domain-containing protein [Metabacillus malikii]
MIVPLREGYDKERLLIGGKAKNLSKMMKAGIEVPDGFIITSDALSHFIKTHHLAEQIDYLIQTEENPNQKIQQCFLSHEMPSDLEKEIRSAYDALRSSSGGSHVSVRSSAAAEDLQHQSFAGQYETYLNIGSYDHLVESIKKCWVSIWSDQALRYVQHAEMNSKSSKISILVQVMIQADISGVAFSVNPITSDSDEVVINCSYGLGESVVSGLVTPDMFIVSKLNHDVIHRELGDKECKIIGTAEGIEEVPTSQQESSSFCVNEEQLKKLTEIVQEIEDYYQYPVDIEFGIRNDDIYVLQTRPITTLKEVTEVD